MMVSIMAYAVNGAASFSVDPARTSKEELFELFELFVSDMLNVVSWLCDWNGDGSPTDIA